LGKKRSILTENAINAFQVQLENALMRKRKGLRENGWFFPFENPPWGLMSAEEQLDG